MMKDRAKDQCQGRWRQCREVNLAAQRRHKEERKLDAAISFESW